ncbi:hydroxymethylbilane synthase [Streptomyces sp. NPDC056549]|uniref:hydroxymethylbilane synthase n=1 Tax=Streptomyces sp. NPDC056549 TaxID=3345864 RepID=UPI0036BBA088
MQVVVGSRASRLAKAQVREVLAVWRELFPEVEFVQRAILEDGDLDRRTPTIGEVARAAGRASAFASKQEQALVTGVVDVVVHSLKDLPTSMAEGLTLLRPPGPRQDVRDALCGRALAELPPGARVGTGAPRRIGQLLALRPDLDVVPVRGNVPTRLRTLRESNKYDAVILAVAGLARLGLERHISEILDTDMFLPSPGQGALGVQVRAESAAAMLLSGTGSAEVDAATRAERALLAELHGGCSVPVGAWARTSEDGLLRLTAMVTSMDGKQQHRVEKEGDPSKPAKLGRVAAKQLLEMGAGAVLAGAR